ncbi:MAG: hypothetical protein AAF223_01265, partial [Bacteroidota bacterium]
MDSARLTVWWFSTISTHCLARTRTPWVGSSAILYTRANPDICIDGGYFFVDEVGTESFHDGLRHQYFTLALYQL